MFSTTDIEGTILGENSSNNSLVGWTNDELQPLSVTEILANVVFALVGSSTLILNGIVLAGFVKERRVRETPGNVFIQNLATSDSVIGIFIWYVVVLNLCRFDNDYEYLFRMGFICSFLLASTFFLNFLTIDRYLKITMHLRYESLVTSRTHHIVCIFTWVGCAIVGVLPLAGWHNPDVVSRSFFETFNASYILMVFVVGFILPMVSMIFAYSSLYMISREHARKIASQTQTTKDSNDRNKNRKVIKSIFLLIGAYVVCWLPLAIYSMVGISEGKDPNDTAFPWFTLLVALGFMNSLLNPLIYATKIDEIRAFFRKVCCRCKVDNQSIVFSIADTNQPVNQQVIGSTV